MDEKLVKKTQDTLGKLIKKPPLTEKLLKKPPFRFLHDIITSVIKGTGFMNGLFEDKELSSENVKDKDSKLAFLQKAIDLVVLVTGKSLGVRPTKVVAGQEPEKTNEFLQALATAINKNVDNDEYVQRLLSGDKSGSGKPSSASKSKEREKSQDKNKGRDLSADKRKKESSRKGSGNDDKRTSSGKEDKRPSSKDSDRGDKKDRRDSGRREERNSGRKERDEENKENEKDRNRRGRQKREKEDNNKNEEKREDNEETIVNGETGEDDNGGEDHPVRISRPTSAKGPRRRHRDEEEEVERIRAEQERQKQVEPETNGIGEDDLPPQVVAARRMARPSSARPAAPRIKKQEQVQEDPLARLGSGKQSANVIVDGNHSDDDDFVVEESGPSHVEIEREPTPPQTEDDGEHGGLVRKMLESKKDLEGGSQTAKAKNSKQEPEKPFYNDAARRKEREMVQREIEKLRNSIQTLTRSANPLGKIMDYVQEDLDSMQKELEMWKRENKEHSLALKREQSVTDSSIEPLKAQLSEIDQAIVDQIDQIAATKSNITRNDEKVEKMLNSITKS